MSIDDLPVENLPDDWVLVAGGGPVGLVFALVLAHHGVRSVLLERNVETTRFPKMDLTLARTMELFRRLGFADAIRAEGVPSSEPFTVRFSSGLGAENTLTSWDMPSVDGFRERMASNNDGSMPLEPWQRIPGDILERWLRAKCKNSPLIDARYGWTITDAEEQDEGVEITVLAPDTTTPRKIRCSYAVGCEGASSVLRKSLGIAIDGGPLDKPSWVKNPSDKNHFTELALPRLSIPSPETYKKIQRQGSFWHTFFPSDPSMMGKSLSGAIIAHAAKEVWTFHEYLTPGYEPDEQNAKEAIMRVLGGMGKPYEIEVDEIIVQSTFKPTVALTESWSGKKQRIFLANDSCHQTVPSGGYGMILGLADAWDLGWKLAAKIHGWGGPNLLASYEVERRPVAELMQHWGKVHGMKQLGLPMAVKMDPAIIDSSDQKGQALRKTIHDYIQTNNDHNQSFGVELGYRYESSLCVPGPLDEALPPPTFNNRTYTPTTYPGYRSPHVFLKDGSAIFDHYGSGFTLVAFADNFKDESINSASSIFEAAAKQNKIPLKVVPLVGESNASQIWGAKLVVVRPDGHDI